MKKAIIYMVLVVAASFVAVTCVNPLDNPQSPVDGKTVVNLVPVCDVMSTKVEADNTYNENLIADYYWFIYNSNAETAEPIKFGHKNGSGPEAVSLDGLVDPNATSFTGYLYMIANLPSEYTYDDERGILKNGTPVGLTVTAMTAIDFGVDMPRGSEMPSSYNADGAFSEFYRYTSATTGYPDPKKFVMRTPSPLEFMVNANTPRTVEASLERVAVKIILDLNVAKIVTQNHTQNGAEVYFKTWEADIEHIQVYMLWGSTHGNLAGRQLRYGETNVNANWFYSASPRYAMYVGPKGGGNYISAISTVEGSVPAVTAGQQRKPGEYEESTFLVRNTEWESVWITYPEPNDWIWICDSEDKIDENKGDPYYGRWNFYPDEEHKQPKIDPETGNQERRSYNKTHSEDCFTISSLPLYSMPIKWNTIDAHAPFIKIVLPWQGITYENDGAGPGFARDPKTTEFYYKVLIPQQLDGCHIDANNCYHIKLDLSVLGGEADEVPVELFGQYYVIDWNTASEEPMGGNQHVGRYIDCRTSFEFYSQNEMEIPVSSSHDIEIVGTPTATYQNYSGTTVTTGNLSYSPSSSVDNNFTVTAVGNNKVTVVHNFNTDLTSLQPRDVAPITYTVTIQHKGEGGSAYRKTITIVQYPSLYVRQDPSNHYVFVNSYGGGNSTVSAFDDSGPTFYYNDVTDSNYLTTTRLAAFLGNVVSPNANLGTGNANTNNYNIYVSALKELPSNLADAYIADPREDTGTTLSNINNLTNYRATRQDATMAISPAYKIASSYGMCANFRNSNNNSIYGGIYYDNAVKRCATYQENGYPAGRWRVPTKAEILFAVSLSNSGCIPPLFNGAYRANDGQYYDSTTSTFTGSSTDRSAVRCVYDVWYWGENKYDNNGNEITGTGTAATQWIGFKN